MAIMLLFYVSTVCFSGTLPYQAQLTINSRLANADPIDFPVLINEANLPSDMLNPISGNISWQYDSTFRGMILSKAVSYAY